MDIKGGLDGILNCLWYNCRDWMGKSLRNEITGQFRVVLLFDGIDYFRYSVGYSFA